MRKAIIVESPTKTRTLSRFLGDEYKLLASRGHVRDLVRDGLAVDVEKNFEPDYEILPSQKKTVRDLKKELKDDDQFADEQPPPGVDGPPPVRKRS